MRTLGNRTWSKLFDVPPIVLDRQCHRSINTLHANPAGRGTGVLPDITQTFLNYLNQLCRQSIFDYDFIFTHDVDFQTIVIRKLTCKTSHGRQETFTHITLLQALREPAQVTYLILRHFQQVADISRDVSSLRQLVLNRCHFILQTDVSLYDCVVNVARQSLSFMFGGTSRQPVEQANVLDDGHRLVGHLHEEFEITTFESSSLAHEE